MLGWLTAASAALSIGTPAAPSAAASFFQAGPSLSVGTITSKQKCTYFQESAGRSAAVVTPYTMATASSWRSWWVKDCVDNFATMRTSLQAALAAGGGVALRTSGGRYVVSGSISDVIGGGGPAPTAPGADWAMQTNGMMVSMDVTVRDGAGRIVFGGLLSKTIQTGFNIQADGTRSYGSMSGEGLYGLMQQELALAVARMVCFHFTPLRVSDVRGKNITLNYGAPLLKLGTIVQVQGQGGDVLRFSVTSAAQGTAVAVLDADGDMDEIAPGALGNVIEADDPAANGRRMKRVELP
jgi:hypothetical protein